MTIIYVYKAALYCETCGERIRAELTAQGKAPADPDDQASYDSDEFPKDLIAGETDSLNFCDSGERCADPIALKSGHKIGCYLKEDLTEEGIKNVQESLSESDLDPVLRKIYKDVADAHNVDYLTEDQIKELRAKCRTDAADTAQYKQLAKDLDIAIDAPAVAEMRLDDGTLPQYTSLGSYTIGYYKKDGDMLCAECASEPDNGAAYVEPFYEGAAQFCVECNKEIETAQAGGCVVEKSPSGEHCQVTFAEKPDREVLAALRSAGFHFSGGSWFGQTKDLPAEVPQQVEA